MNILLIEPDRVLADILIASLKKSSRMIVHKRTAQSAVDSLDEKTPDVIILETQLGIHNGIEFLHELRSHNEWQSIPVIVHTKNVNALRDEFINAWKQVGASQVFYKPETSIKKLVNAVDNLLVLNK